MKKILLIFTTIIMGNIFGFSQKFDYQKKWEEIENQQKKGNHKSLLPKITEIYNQATKDKNYPQIVKSITYKHNISHQIDDDNEGNYEVKIINDLEKEINSQKNNISASLLNSLLADVYEKYALKTRYKRGDATELENKENDFRTWSNSQFNIKINELYKNALIDSSLKTEKSNDWIEVLTPKDGDIEFRPTLYDIISNRYIDYLNSNSLYLNDEERNTNNKAKEDLKNKLLDFHLNDKDRTAYANYKMLNIIAEDLENAEKIRKLYDLSNEFKSTDYNVFITYYLASLVKNSDKKIEVNYLEGSDNLVKAHNLCKKTIEKNPNNKWISNLKNLQSEIEISSYAINLDQSLLPKEGISVFINYKNLKKIYYKIYDANPGAFSNINSNNSFFDFGIFSSKGSKLIKSGFFDLKNFEDFNNHSTILKIDGLEKGNYRIEFSNNEKFNSKERMYSTNRIIVDDFTYIKLEDNKFQLVNKKTGEPIKNKEVSILKLNYKSTITTLNKIKDLKTDDKGIIDLSGLNSENYRNRNYLYNGTFYINIERYYNYYGNNKETHNVLNFFLDRKIYRPGQTVYFKAVSYNKNEEKTSLNTKQSTTVYLRNANGETVSQLTLTTNEFGSVFGEFVLPQNGLTGNYSLQSNYGSINFQVEEYKRPKFEVTFEKLEGEYTLQKEITAKGKAESFSGTAISESKVVYRVEREEIFPYYRWWWPMPSSSPETIIQGETKTDSDGNFEVKFIAKPKEERKKDNYRTYTYIVYADVSDINGETHSSETRITVGDLPIILSFKTPEKIIQKDFKEIIIKSTNLNEVPTASKGNITITQLQTPNRIILPQKQNQVPDFQTLSEAEFYKNFPHLPYSSDDQNPDKWKKLSSFNLNFDTSKSDKISVGKNLEKGYYLVEALSMYGKDSIKTQQIIQIQDNNSLQSSENVFFNVSTSKNSYNIGENIDINLYSDFDSGYALVNVENDEKIQQEVISLKKGKNNYSLKAKTEHLKGLIIKVYFVKEGGCSVETISPKVLDKPKDLIVTTKVFRDKITPGAKETWELTISGKDKDNVTAEVLATMYDASLDQFMSNDFSFDPWTYNYYSKMKYTSISNYNISYYQGQSTYDYINAKHPKYLHLITIDRDYRYHYLHERGHKNVVAAKAPRPSMELDMITDAKFDDMELEESAVAADIGGAIAKQKEDKKPKDKLDNVKARTNLQETALFYPNLYTDEKGNLKLTFTSPEALTKWKLLILAHTKDLKSGTAEFYTQTQKELMVVPNVPRFLREGDKISISTKITNLSKKKLKGSAKLLLFDALTMKPIDDSFGNKDNTKKFSAESSKNTEVNWDIKVPFGVQAITYRIVAQAGNFSDGEENILPVLTNRMLVTETLAISIKENQTKNYRFDKLIDNKSNSLKNFNLSMELTTNPTWLAVMSLPYLREYPYECSEQLFSRLYGNTLSSYIINSSPKIKNVFDEWNSKGLAVSNLEKNQELKNILLEETPWIRQAQNETERMKRISILFDLNKMKNEAEQAQNKLFRRQNGNGGFAWFEGGESSRYISEHIVAGFGKLKNMLGDKSGEYLNSNMKSIVSKSIKYIDAETLKQIKEDKKKKYKVKGMSFIHYYYARSFWNKEYSIPSEISSYLKDIQKEINENFSSFDLQNKAMLAIVMNRYGYSKEAELLIKNMKETSVEADELGMYWKNNLAGWYWYQAPIETQSKIIEAFAEITPEDIRSVEEMKVWLIKNKQTQGWYSTKSTTEAVYALMNYGKDWKNAEEGIKVSLGNEQIYPTKNPTTEQASGYLKQSWNAEQIKPEMGNIKVEKTSPGVAWGGMYWQYFEDLDKITKADSKIKMDKQLFIKSNTDKGQQLKEIKDNNKIKVGDLITVRLVIKVDRDMDYIHIKDMRASGFEPINVLSGYKYQNSVGYYESTRDAATNFFFSYMPKGLYIFEYDVRANNRGEFSNGITQLQNMYAPEMSAHSSGIRINIE